MDSGGKPAKLPISIGDRADECLISLAQLFLGRAQYLHQVFWNSFFRWGTLALGLAYLPFIHPAMAEQRWFPARVFPVTSVFIILIATWHLSAEYSRLTGANDLYVACLSKLRIEPPMMPRFVRAPIGWVMIGVFCIGLLVAAICAWCLLGNIPQHLPPASAW